MSRPGSATAGIEPRRAGRSIWAPLLVSAAVLALTAIASAIVAHDATAKARERFIRAAQLARSGIEGRAALYVSSLRGLAGFFAAGDRVTRRDFRRYVRRLDLPERLPGMVAVAWSPRVVAERAGESFPVLFAEGPDRSRPDLAGRDLATDPQALSAMHRARDRARPAAGAPGPVPADADPCTAPRTMTLYLPVFDGDDVPGTVPERRSRLAGFVHATIDVPGLFGALQGVAGESALVFEAYDAVAPDPARCLYRTPAHVSGGRPARFETTARIGIAGRTWTLLLRSHPRFDASVASAAPAVLLASGVAIALLAFIVLRAQLDARMRAERASLELRQSEEALRAAHRAKDEFLASLSHELRTPLGNVLLWLQLLRQRGDDGETASRAVATIERNARMLARLLDDLLDVSRIVSGKLSLTFRPTELGRIVRSAIDEARPRAEAKAITIALESDAEHWVSGDPARLTQVVENLLSNAVKFTPDGGRIVVRMSAAQGQVRIEVRDTGIGIEPALLPHVFERFRQGRGHGPQGHGGLGLGLAIVRHLVERHGGRVGAQSDGAGCGATFMVALPLLHGGTALGWTGSAPAPPGTSAPLEGIRALVVEDQPDARDALATVLGEAGARVTSVASAGEALDALRHGVPDVVLSDVAMPGSDGYHLIRRIRALDPQHGGTVPAVAVTAYATPEDRRRAFEAGFQAHVAKPLEASELVATVASLVAARGRPALTRLAAPT